MWEEINLSDLEKRREIPLPPLLKSPAIISWPSARPPMTAGWARVTQFGSNPQRLQAGRGQNSVRTQMLEPSLRARISPASALELG